MVDGFNCAKTAEAGPPCYLSPTIDSGLPLYSTSVYSLVSLFIYYSRRSRSVILDLISPPVVRFVTIAFSPNIITPVTTKLVSSTPVNEDINVSDSTVNGVLTDTIRSNSTRQV